VPQKRIELLLRAVLELPQPMRLVLAGPMSHCSSYAEELRRVAGDSERVTWLGSVPFAELVELYRRATAVVLPSDAEGCSCTLLEALTAGACVVASDIDENVELLGRAGITVPAGDGDALARALHTLVTDPDRVQRVRKAALARSATLATWDDVEQRLAALYVAGAADAIGEPRVRQLTAEVEFTPES
jgi:glycosyltransferase involved in cell wall biosynthesis